MVRSNLEIDFLRHERVDTAFDFVEAGPAACATVFPIGGFSGARLTTNRTVTLIVQGIIWDAMLPQVIPNTVARPFSHGIQLHNVTPGRFIERIKLDQTNRGSRIGLLAS